MDGLTTTRYIRSSMPMDKQPYIIALTADARQEARDAMFSEGVNEYLTKPVHQNMLAQALDYAIKNQQSDDLLRVSPGVQEMRTRTDGTPIDESIIDDFMTLMGEDSKEALAELFDTFLDNTPKLVQEMKTASSEGNWRSVRWTAHTLKGNCELLGGVQLVQMCRELISQIDNQSTAQVSQRVDQIEVEFAGMQTLIRSKRELL
jgi:HPt (histidine-containing phosphotransfer) domain-containing protein